VGTGSAAARQDDTFPKLLLRNAEIYADRPAMREKDLGIWQTWTWADVLDEARAFAIGLKSIGVKAGDKIAIVGDNRPRLYWTVVVAQSIGVIPVPVYQDSVAEEMAFVLEHAGVTHLIVEDQEQVDKILEVRETNKNIQTIIYDDQRGLGDYKVEGLYDYEDVTKAGRERLASSDNVEREWLDGVAAGKGSDTAIMLYTSGTTGQPKGVVLSQDNVLISARNACEFEGLSETDEILAYLPMAWIGDHIFSFGQSYVSGFCVACPESPETMIQDLREIGPTYYFAPPRIFENLLTTVMIRMEDASAFKQKMFKYFLDVARRVGEPIHELGQPEHALLPILHATQEQQAERAGTSPLGFEELVGIDAVVDVKGGLGVEAIAPHEVVVDPGGDANARVHESPKRRRGSVGAGLRAVHDHHAADALGEITGEVHLHRSHADVDKHALVPGLLDVTAHGRRGRGLVAPADDCLPTAVLAPPDRITHHRRRVLAHADPSHLEAVPSQCGTKRPVDRIHPTEVRRTEKRVTTRGRRRAGRLARLPIGLVCNHVRSASINARC